MWNTSPCPSYVCVWITVNNVVHAAMYDGRYYKTVNGEYTSIDAWCRLVPPLAYLPPKKYDADSIMALMKDCGPRTAGELRVALRQPKGRYNSLYHILERLVDSKKLNKQGTTYYANLS